MFRRGLDAREAGVWSRGCGGVECEERLPREERVDRRERVQRGVDLVVEAAAGDALAACSREG